MSYSRTFKALAVSSLCLVGISSSVTSAHAVMLRKNILNLTANELQGLRDAVAAMKALPASDPCSWTFQANIHNTQCNHTSSYWLPWHRMYLYYFEKILVSKSGGKLKGLPYWDYANSAQTTFPPSFYASTYGASLPNPLYHTPRTNVTSSSFALNFASTDAAPSNSNLTFSGFSSTLQSAPHNYVHGAIGGTMGNFQSPLDPIFWTHHCVIDRLWQKWLALGGGRANPTFNTTWMNQSFSFYDIDLGCVTTSLRVQDVLDPETQLNYKYVEPLKILPVKWWWKWLEFIHIKFPEPRYLVYGYDRVRFPVPLDRTDIKRLGEAFKTKNQLNAVLTFKVSKGENTLVPYDVVVLGASGRKTRVGTLAVFGVRQKRDGHMHGETGRYDFTLGPKQTLQFLSAIREGRGELSFEPQMKGIVRQKDAQPIAMRLEQVTVMKAIKVDKEGKQID